jgi:Amt family ammonium transporter
MLYRQFAYACACVGYTMVVTWLICKAVNYIPGCHLRISEEGEARGVDEDQVGEFAYDYVEVRRDYLAWTPPSQHLMGTSPQVSATNSIIEDVHRLPRVDGDEESHDGSAPIPEKVPPKTEEN